MHVHAFIEEMERLAPPELAEDFDAEKIGLVVEGRPEISRVCCALDVTPYVVKQATIASADMLVVHHTPLWTPVTTITGRIAGLMRDLLSADMNLYVMHTNFDRAQEGVNDALAELLSLTGISPMSIGCIGSCTLSPAEISRKLGGNCRLWGKVKKIRRLALVGGSGFDPETPERSKSTGCRCFSFSRDETFSCSYCSPSLHRGYPLCTRSAGNAAAFLKDGLAVYRRSTTSEDYPMNDLWQHLAEKKVLDASLRLEIEEALGTRGKKDSLQPLIQVKSKNTWIFLSLKARLPNM